MYELRVRVFSHLQRLSLDFYTEEKAGRLMTRMTSDIDVAHRSSSRTAWSTSSSRA